MQSSTAAARGIWSCTIGAHDADTHQVLTNAVCHRYPTHSHRCIPAHVSCVVESSLSDAADRNRLNCTWAVHLFQVQSIISY